MANYIKFWMAKDFAEFLMVVAVVAIPVSFIGLAILADAIKKRLRPEYCENHQSDCAQKSGGICTCISNNQQSKQD